MSLTLPILHLGGTSQNVLLEDYGNAIISVEQALTTLIETSPNGRDYPKGPESHKDAVAEHVARCNKLREVLAELRQIETHIAGV